MFLGYSVNGLVENKQQNNQNKYNANNQTVT